MNPNQLAVLAGLLSALNEFNTQNEAIAVHITSLTIDTDGGTANILFSGEEGLYLQLP